MVQRPDQQLHYEYSRHLADSGHRNFSRWDWRIVLNGHADEMLYEHGDLAGDLPFDEFKSRVLINPAAQAADKAADFSDRIRENRPASKTKESAIGFNRKERKEKSAKNAKKSNRKSFLRVL